MKNYLAIDIGASSGRHILGRVEGGKITLEEVFRFENRQVRRGGHDCWDIDGLVDSVKAGIDAALAEVRHGPVRSVPDYLRDRLAPRETRHGVLVNVFGAGLLITGNSGVGKSEAALELVKRGHQLVADDVVDIRRVEDNRLIGESPELVRHFMEIRGVGIIDVSTMYGAGAIMRSKHIDMVIHLELWQADKEYDRLGLTDNYIEILGVKVPSLLLPIHPGRNLAVVLEVAARNLRLKQMGYNAANELTRRHMARFQNNLEE